MNSILKGKTDPARKIARRAFVMVLAFAMIAGSFAVPAGVRAEAAVDEGIGEPISRPMDMRSVVMKEGEATDPADTLKIEVYQDYTKAFEVLDIVNSERQKQGLEPLIMDEGLLESGMHRAAETVILGSHGRPDGTLCFTIDSHMSGENYAWGFSTPQSVMDAWMNSEGHRANILREGFTHIGIGCIRYNGAYHWIQCFGAADAEEDCGRPEDGSAVRAINMPYNTITDPYRNTTVTFSFSIYPSNKTIVVGDSRDLTLKMDSVTFLDGEDSVYWRSDDETVATVDENGVVTGVGPGNVVITASSRYLDRKSISLNVTIAPENKRIYGSNRVDTSIEAAKKLKEKLGADKFDFMIVASGSSFADALSGSWLSAVKSAPILLVDFRSEDKVAQYVGQNLADEGTVYILGGPNAVRSSFEELLAGMNVKRLQGESRFDTNMAILEETDTSGHDLLVCYGLDYPDALSVSSVGMPIMLVGKELSDDQKSYLENAGFGEIHVIGGTAVISKDLADGLAEYASVSRIGGANRFETSLKVAGTFFPGHHDYLMMVYALDFPDGLSGGALAYQYDAPVILATSSNVSAAVAYRGASGAARSITLGGPKLISDNAIFTAMGNNTPIQVN